MTLSEVSTSDEKNQAFIVEPRIVGLSVYQNTKVLSNLFGQHLCVFDPANEGIITVHNSSEKSKN
ncbi:hypothetical protein BV902_25615 [Sphingobacterium sp. B29]|nr:hypothetical protein BV902_25615 [Sphingobacterium sp. B29]